MSVEAPLKEKVTVSKLKPHFPGFSKKIICWGVSVLYYDINKSTLQVSSDSVGVLIQKSGAILFSDHVSFQRCEHAHVHVVAGICQTFRVSYHNFMQKAPVNYVHTNPRQQRPLFFSIGFIPRNILYLINLLKQHV